MFCTPGQIGFFIRICRDLKACDAVKVCRSIFPPVISPLMARSSRKEAISMAGYSLRPLPRPKRSAKSSNVSAYPLDRRRLHGPSGSTILTMRKPAWVAKPPRPSEEVCLNGLMVCWQSRLIMLHYPQHHTRYHVAAEKRSWAVVCDPRFLPDPIRG